MAFTGEIFSPRSTRPVWSEQFPKIWTFQDDDDFNSYLLEVRTVLKGIVDMYPYNSIPSFVDFYRKYKASGLASLSQFYQDHYEVEFSNDSLSCVGQSVLFMLDLKKSLSSGRYSDTCDCLYYASCNEFPTEDVPAVFENGKPLCPPELTKHVTVALKFVVQKRKGHVIMDFGFGLDFPVVVMEDGDAPQTDSFDMATYVGTRSHCFRYATSNFILWTVRQPDKTVHRYIYLTHAFQRLDIPEKRLKVNPLQAEIVTKEGWPLAAYFGSPGQNPGVLRVYVNNSGDAKSTKIPYNEVFVDGKMTNEVLNACLEFLGPTAMEDVRSFVESCQDASFSEQLLEMDKNFRDILADIWNNANGTVQSPYVSVNVEIYQSSCGTLNK